MGALKGFAIRLRAILRAQKTDRELAEEIRFHLDLETEKNIRLGMTPDDARRLAMSHFGGVQRVREEHRDVRGARWFEEFLNDARYALRGFRRSPTLAGAAIVTLALGVGANTAIFSAVNAVILKPLPFASPRQLVMLWEENPEKGWYKQVAAPANYLDWRAQVPAFQDAAAYIDGTGSETLTGRGEPRYLRTQGVTGNFFATLGVGPALGRVPRDEESWAPASRVAVLSHRAWRDEFGADPKIIGQSIVLNGRHLQVIGVMEEGFSFPTPNIDVWSGIGWDRKDPADISFRRAHWLRVVARVRSGVSLTQANAQLQEVVNRLKHDYPITNTYMGAGMTPLHEFLVGDTKPALLVLLAAVGLLLLIACANVGNLMLVRAAEREREVAVRVALGAAGSRLVRQAITESLVLSAVGGVAGLALGWAGTRALVALKPQGLLRVDTFTFDWRVLVYVFAIVALSGLIFGVAPAVWSYHQDPADALRDRGRASDGYRARRWGSALVISEVALALLLTIGAGLLVRSLDALRRVNPGFDPNGVLAVTLSASSQRYDSGDKVQIFYDELLRRVRGLPDVERAATVSDLPLVSTGYSSDFIAAGRPADDFGIEVSHRQVSPDYFATMRVPIVRGREFVETDTRAAPRVVVINRALAESYFRGQDPVGQRITFDRVPDTSSAWRTIVGVVGNEHTEGLSATPKIEIIESSRQARSSYMTLVVRARPASNGSANPGSLGPSIRSVVRQMDPDLAIVSMKTMDNVRAESLARERFITTLLVVFSGVGLALALVGVYGVLAQLARGRTREMGIRIALGAQGSEVRWLVLRHGMLLTLAGIVLGGSAAWASTRLMAKLLFNVRPGDPLTFAIVAVLLGLTGAAASWIPALTASRADPALTLRAD